MNVRIFSKECREKVLRRVHTKCGKRSCVENRSQELHAKSHRRKAAAARSGEMSNTTTTFSFVINNLRYLVAVTYTVQNRVCSCVGSSVSGIDILKA